MSDIEKQISSTIISKTFKEIQKRPLKNIGCSVGLIDNNIIKFL